MNIYDEIALDVRKFWLDTGYAMPVIVFFKSKFNFDDDYVLCGEMVDCDSDTDFETVTFLNDFGEGQNYYILIKIVPLDEVIEFYAKNF